MIIDVIALIVQYTGFGLLAFGVFLLYWIKPTPIIDAEPTPNRPFKLVSSTWMETAKSPEHIVPIKDQGSYQLF